MEREQTTISIPKDAFKKLLQEEGVALNKLPHRCNEFFVFPDDNKKRIILGPIRENAVIDIGAEKAGELAQIIQYQIRAWNREKISRKWLRGEQKKKKKPTAIEKRKRLNYITNTISIISLVISIVVLLKILGIL